MPQANWRYRLGVVCGSRVYGPALLWSWWTWSWVRKQEVRQLLRWTWLTWDRKE
jgi:hypothetical protein